MFDNIGGKIKSLAKVTCWIGIIISLIAAIVMMISSKYAVLFGLLVLIVGPLISWISSFALYGFGELIETNCEIAKNTRGSSARSLTDAFSGFASNTNAHSWRGTCEICNRNDIMVSSVKGKNMCGDCAIMYNLNQNMK